MRHLIPLAFTLAALIVLHAPTGARAQDDAMATPAATPEASAFSINVEPQDDPAVTERGYFVFEIGDGDAASGSVRLRNTGSEPVTIELAAVDGETAQAGGSAYADVNAAPVAAGAWITLDETAVTLQPDEQVSLGFTVEPPAGTAPGQFLAGIVAYLPAGPEGTPVATGANQAGASLFVQTRYVIPVQANIPGEWDPSLTITGASALEQPSGTKLGIALRNDGDTFLQPEGSVTLSGADGSEILSEPVRLGTFISGTSVTYPIPWPGVPEAGEYSVEVELTYAEDEVARYSGTFTVSEDAPAAPAAQDDAVQPAPAQPETVPAPALIQPWMLFAIGGLLALIALLLILILVRQSRNGRRGSGW